MRGWMSAVVLLAVSITLVASGAALGQQFTLASPGVRQGLAAGDTFSVALQATDLVGTAKAISWWASVEPTTAVDMTKEGITYTSPAPGYFGSGELGVVISGNVVEIGTASFTGTPISGSGSMGKLTFHMGAGATQLTGVTVTIDSIKYAASGAELALTPVTPLHLQTVVNEHGPAPTVTGVVPASGLVTGTNEVTISGTDFADGATVTFGGVAATGVTFVSETTLTATVPPAAAPGAVDIVVTNPDTQSATLAGGYTYEPIPGPAVTAVIPASGLVTGTNQVTVVGSHFAEGATVKFGATAATGVAFVSADTLTATVPPAAAAGAVNVVVTNPDGQSGTLTGGYTYQPIPAPAVTAVVPASGSVTGGNRVTIVGSHFADGATVKFGAAAATGVTFVGADTLTAAVPAGAAPGAVNVVVTNPDAQSGTLTGGYTYLAVVEPALDAVGATDRSLAYSAVGTGALADASAGEVTFSVSFKDSTGAARSARAVSWSITNNGAQPVYLLGAQATTIAAGAQQAVSVATGAGGTCAIVLDAEGGKDAGTTSVTVTASATAGNSDGVARDLSQSFAATWDVAVVAELTSFLGGVVPGDGVVLQWTVSSQTNNLGWEVYRSQDNVTFEQVGSLVAGDGTSDELKTYSFADGDLPAADVLYYYLNQVDLDGTTSRSATIQVVLSDGAQALPKVSTLLQNTPNPFNPETTIAYDLAQAATVSLTVYDANGRFVRTLVDGQSMSPGRYRSVWDGTDQSGAKVASGVYFYVLRGGSFSASKRMLLLQ